MGIKERIIEIEAEMNRTQKNKNTEYHLGRLKAQLAKLRRELLDPNSKIKSILNQKNPKAEEESDLQWKKVEMHVSPLLDSLLLENPPFFLP
jgi:Mg2+ and Co2+ transporter CorA